MYEVELAWWYLSVFVALLGKDRASFSLHTAGAFGLMRSIKTYTQGEDYFFWKQFFTMFDTVFFGFMLWG